MKQKIVTHIISSFLDVGKTIFINQSLKIKPRNKNWVLLVNESSSSHYATEQLASQGIIVKERYGAVYVVAQASFITQY